MFTSISYGAREGMMDPDLENRVQRALRALEEGIEQTLKDPDARALFLTEKEEELTRRNDDLMRRVRQELEMSVGGINREINTILRSDAYREELEKIKGDRDKETRLYKGFVGVLVMKSREIEEAIMGRYSTAILELSSLLLGVSDLRARLNL